MRPFICILFVLCMALVACKPKQPEPVTYEGHIYNRDNHAVPLAGVKVTLNACAKTLGEVDEHCDKSRVLVGTDVTDAEGHFFIEGDAAVMNWYFVTFSSTKSTSVAFEVSNDGTSSAGLSAEKYTTLYSL